MLNIIEQNGKKYVSAKELYEALELNPANYSRWAKNNIENSKSNLKDYSSLVKSEKTKGKTAKEYILSINFAKFITASSGSEKSLQYIEWLISLENQKQSLDLLTHEEVLQLTMLVKCFSYLENCVYAEQMNMQKFIEQSKNKNPYADFHTQRNRILELDTKVIEQRLKDFCLEHERSYSKGLTKREKQAIYDKYEILKAGVWDYLTFKGSEHALKLANLCKEMARISNGEMYKENKTDLFRLQEKEANVLQLNS